MVEQILCGGGLLCASQLKLFSGISGEKSHIGFDSFHQILPSRTTISRCVKTTAAHKIIHLGIQMLKAARVYLGCDKGGGVLIKMASSMTRRKRASRVSILILIRVEKMLKQAELQ